MSKGISEVVFTLAMVLFLLVVFLTGTVLPMP